MHLYKRQRAKSMALQLKGPWIYVIWHITNAIYQNLTLSASHEHSFLINDYLWHRFVFCCLLWAAKPCGCRAFAQNRNVCSYNSYTTETCMGYLDKRCNCPRLLHFSVSYRFKIVFLEGSEKRNIKLFCIISHIGLFIYLCCCFSVPLQGHKGDQGLKVSDKFDSLYYLTVNIACVCLCVCVSDIDQ